MIDDTRVDHLLATFLRDICINQRTVAQILDVCPSTVSRWRHRKQPATVKDLKRTIAAVKVQVNYILHRAEKLENIIATIYEINNEAKSKLHKLAEEYENDR